MCDSAPNPLGSDFDSNEGFAGGMFGLTTDPFSSALIAGYRGSAEDQWKEALGMDDGGGTSAASLRAQIAREQWADYKQRFQPIENILLGYANDPKGFAKMNREEAVGRVTSAYDRAPAQIERRMESYGLQVTPEMQDRIAKRLNYDKGLSTVQAANMSERLSNDQTQGIISGDLLVGNRQATTNQRPTGGGG